ncbi:unnamed protein product [Protopolystoma xenopodis]|uniref:Uncharacterized protein n=1 Tax=Protopolystoma xenopodis TaxID=117903 RepID=A0A3S5ASH7_9PLAT|nr:unnamed protein product [Protopolystoma xenopodis]
MGIRKRETIILAVSAFIARRVERPATSNRLQERPSSSEWTVFFPFRRVAFLAHELPDGFVHEQAAY